MIVSLSQTTADVLLFYPGKSLNDQVRHWNVRRPAYRVWNTEERSLPAIRQLLRSGTAALIDATHDASRAADAFLQAVARLGVGSVVVYSEISNEYIEQFVRMRGSLFLLGPMLDDQWDDFFNSFLNHHYRSAKAA